ncbi:hypothetical protein WDW89_09200, partial [Deltaproteobacteria bacterium TL4]
TFTPDNWNAEQLVTVTGLDDNIADGDQTYPVLLGKTTSDNPNYHQLDPQDVLVVNRDDETTGFTISAIQGQTSEAGETATFTIKLNSEPTGAVVLEVVSSDPSEGTASPVKLTFTSSNWNANQTVTVTGMDDTEEDGNQNYHIVMGAAQSTDFGYQGLTPESVIVTNFETVVHVPDTGQTTSYTDTFGEDHDYLINAPSYTDNSNSTITDNVTGLLWQKQDDGKTRTWDSAGTYCTGLNLGDYSSG